MTRNAIILSPHPGAKACSADAARTLAEAAKAAGAPDGVIQVLEEPSIPLIEKIIGDERIDLIVATGGPSVVKASYRSGNPAMGVGPGNAPVLVDDSADIKLAAKRIVASKSFDNSILCTNEVRGAGVHVDRRPVAGGIEGREARISARRSRPGCCAGCCSPSTASTRP